MIVMQLVSADCTEKQGVNEPQFSQIWVVLNAKPQAVSFTIPAGKPMFMHKHYRKTMGTLICMCNPV